MCRSSEIQRDERRRKIEETLKACFKGQKERKPNKDERQFNGTAVNDTESAL